MKRIKKNRDYFGCFLCCVFLLFMIVSSTVSAKESSEKTVRIGVFEETYNTVNADGKRDGYGYEYLQKIAGYTGWTYEYVNADWSNVFDKLQNGEIDIIGGISYTEERAANMLFSSIPMAEEKYYLYADMKNTTINISDLGSFDNKNIGVFQDNLPENVLNEWEKKNNIDTQHVNISSEEEVMKNMKDHKMDCFVSVEEPRWSKKGFSPIMNIGASEVYFAVNKERSDLKQELDNALRRITNDDPFYTDELYKQYLSTKSVVLFSEGEQQWIKQHGAIRVGYVSDDLGISSVDSESGKLSGVINDYIDYASDCMDDQPLDFKLIKFGSVKEQMEALKSGKIDMIFNMSQNLYYAEQNNMSLTDAAMTIPIQAVTSKVQFDEGAENHVAIIKGDVEQKWYIDAAYPNWKIIECESLKDVEKMVRQGKADCLLVRTGQARKYMEDNNFQDILLENYDKISFAVNRKDKTLVSILNKTLRSMPDDMLTNALSLYETSMQKITTADYIRDNLRSVIIVCIIVTLVIVVILELLRKSKIAEAKAKEAMQVAEDANAAKSNFLFNMSHDIRTPMNALLGYNQLIKKELTDSTLLHYQEKIEQAGNLLLSIINNVLDMARIESGKIQLNEDYSKVGDILKGVCEVFEVDAKKKGIHLTYETQVTHKYILCDVTSIQKILMDLVSNAVKYTAAGGTIKISSKELPCDQEGFTCIKTEVTDTGIGISKDYIPVIFDSFSREKNTTMGKVAGTGLGMSIVKKLVDMMDGSIEVESEVGKGSRFTLILKLRTVDEKYYRQKTDQMQSDRKELLRGKRILLAEDNELNAEIAITFLEDMGIKVYRVEDGVQCVSRIEQVPADTYDVILMDIQMPHMDGYKATETIRSLQDKEKADIPIVAMTANAFEEDKKEAFDRGMNGHIAKPIDVEKVEEVLFTVLNRKF